MVLGKRQMHERCRHGLQVVHQILNVVIRETAVLQR
jgi:hypothetical protein